MGVKVKFIRQRAAIGALLALIAEVNVSAEFLVNQLGKFPHC
jgi:hypothetical protein